MTGRVLLCPVVSCCVLYSDFFNAIMVSSHFAFVLLLFPFIFIFLS